MCQGAAESEDEGEATLAFGCKVSGYLVVCIEGLVLFVFILLQLWVNFKVIILSAGIDEIALAFKSIVF